MLKLLSILLTRSTFLAACAAMLSVSLNSAYGQIRIYGEILTDPTKPILSSTPVRREPASKPETIQQLFTVGFVRASEKAPIAIVNGKQVTIGSVVDGADIVAISAAGVELEIEGEAPECSCFPDPVVKTFEQ